MPDNLSKNPSFTTTSEGLLLFNKLIYVPSGLRADIFSEKYENIISEYQEIRKTLERITRNYYFPVIKKYVEIFFSEYVVCNRNKILRHVFYG